MEAYALVTASWRGVRHVLLIETDAGWAMPGGAIEPDEKPGCAAVRELREKTGFALSIAGVLDDPRDGIVVARCDLGEVDALHPADGENRRAEWMPTFFVRGRGIPRVRLFPAHRKILGALR